MYIKSAILAIVGSTSPDVLGHKLYVVPEGSGLVRDLDGTVPGADEFLLGSPLPDVGDGKTRWDLSVLPGMSDKDGLFDLGIAAIDDAGNESAFFIIPGAALDFVAPDAPTDGAIERS